MWNQLRETWHILGEPIYVGNRLKANLRALTLASIVTALLGLVLTVMDLRSHDTIMLSAALATFVFASACCFCAGVLKNRELAGVFPTLFCAVVFTIYSVTGVGEGSAMLWTLLMPIGISYFVSVRNGILLSAYYAVLFGVLFHSPLKAQMSDYYNPSFMQRLPLLFDCQALLTGISMVQYHRMARSEIKYAVRLTEEVDRKTRAVREQAKRLAVLNEEMVETLAVTIDAKDRYTNGHSFRVSWYSVALAEKLGWPEQELKQLERETLLHDIGKIGVPDAVLNKPGRLTDEEFAIIQSHTTSTGRVCPMTSSARSWSGTGESSLTPITWTYFWSCSTAALWTGWCSSGRQKWWGDRKQFEAEQYAPPRFFIQESLQQGQQILLRHGQDSLIRPVRDLPYHGHRQYLC